MKTWRDKARPIIQKVLKDTKGLPENEIKKALYNAYPFGERRYHPYKIWLDEIRIQTGKKTNKVEVKKEQLNLFSEAQ
jgi:hypothetical protein